VPFLPVLVLPVPFLPIPDNFSTKTSKHLSELLMEFQWYFSELPFEKKELDF